jgi:hypothetical protein
MAAPVRRYLVEGIVSVVYVFFLRGLLRGKTQIRVSRIGRWRRATSFYLLGALFFKQTMDGGGSEVERCFSAEPAASSLDGMVQRSLIDGRSVMDARRMVVSSGVVVTLMAGLSRSMR